MRCRLSLWAIRPKSQRGNQMARRRVAFELLLCEQGMPRRRMQRQEHPDGGILFHDSIGSRGEGLSPAGGVLCVIPGVKDFVMTDIREDAG